MAKKKKVSEESASKAKRPKSSPLIENRINGISYENGTAEVAMQSGEAILFRGSAHLHVTAGNAWVQGKQVQAGAERIELLADSQSGRLVPIEALHGSRQVPFVDDTVRLRFESTSYPPAAPDSLRSTHADAGPTFELQLPAAVGAAQPLSVPMSWRQAADSLVEAACQSPTVPVVALLGSKNVGKSSFGRLVVNTLLNAYPCVAYLDTDCGQPEFTTPGLVSLHLLRHPVLGSPAVQLRQPAHAHFIGDVSPQCNPALFSAAVRSLHAWYLERAAAAAAAVAGQDGGGAALPPLVVNTHGWIKGIGLDVLAETLQCVHATHVVQLQTGNPRKDPPPGPFWLHPEAPAPPAAAAVPAGPVPGIYYVPALAAALEQERGYPVAAASAGPLGGELPSLTSGQMGASGGNPWSPQASSSTIKGLIPAEARALQWLAFAGLCVGRPLMPPAGADALTAEEAAGLLAAARPFVVGWDDVQVQVLHSTISASELPFAANGALVGLLTEETSPSSDLDGVPECVGIGLVRSIDPARRLLYLLTPTPAEQLQRVTMLQVGKLEFPQALLQGGGFMSPYLRLWCTSSQGGSGSTAIRSRNNLPRASQLAG